MQQAAMKQVKKETWPVAMRIKRAIQKVCRGYAHLAAIEGQPGIGKSYTIKQVLDEEGVTPIILGGYISAAYLFRFLFDNNGEIIWLKDCTKVLEDVRALNILKNATETEGDRTVSSMQYGVLSADLPDNFNFTGRIILDYNMVKPKAKMDWEAILSRAEHVLCVASNREIIQRMFQICEDGWQREVTIHLAKLSPRLLPGQINLRTQSRAFKTYKFAERINEDWREIVEEEVTNALDPIRKRLIPIFGTQPIRVKEAKTAMMLRGEVQTLRTADRRINDWVTCGILEKCSGEIRNYKVRLTAR